MLDLGGGVGFSNCFLGVVVGGGCEGPSFRFFSFLQLGSFALLLSRRKILEIWDKSLLNDQMHSSVLLEASCP